MRQTSTLGPPPVDLIGDRVGLSTNAPRSTIAAKVRLRSADMLGPSRAGRRLRHIAWAGLALIAALGPARAADPCADQEIAVQALRKGDEYQATSLLFAAARFGCEAQARALLDWGAAIDAKDREGATALANAARAGKTAVAMLLIDRGANVNARAVNGSTPLFYAAEADRAVMVRLLLDRGADPNLPGRTNACAAGGRRLQRLDGQRRLAPQARRRPRRPR